MVSRVWKITCNLAALFTILNTRPILIDLKIVDWTPMSAADGEINYTMTTMIEPKTMIKSNRFQLSLK